MDAGPEAPAVKEAKLKAAEDINDRTHFLQVWLNYLVAISTLIGGFFGFWQYLETRKAESEQRLLAMRKAEEDSVQVAQDRLKQDRESLELRRKEFRLKFFEQEMELYLDACRATATLATAENPRGEEVQRAINRFYSLYWGELCVVEGPKVEAAMGAFEKSLREWRDRGNGRASDDMRRTACALAYECRSSLEKMFDLDLGDLPDKPHEFMRNMHSSHDAMDAGHEHGKE